MKKILLFLLCAGWSSAALPMQEPQSKDSAEAPLDFKIHQPFLHTFTFKCTKYSLHEDGQHFF